MVLVGVDGGGRAKKQRLSPSMYGSQTTCDPRPVNVIRSDDVPEKMAPNAAVCTISAMLDEVAR
jgi:hypothetical protein